jgi:hypothetical protein
MRSSWFKRGICSAVTVAMLCASVGPVLADTDSTVRSILVPGTGQAQQGHYTKAAIFAGAAVVTATGWFLSQVHYNQAVMRYNDLREIYLGYPDELAGGDVVQFSEIQQTYIDMTEAYDASEDRQVWRNVFLGAFLVTYTLNIVDVIINKPETGERQEVPEPSVGFQMRGDDIMVYKSFSF